MAISKSDVRKAEANARAPYAKKVQELTEQRDRLLQACEFALRRLNDMTTHEFELGGDRDVRADLTEAIAFAKEGG